MPQAKPDLESGARIKVVGTGGSGNHALTRMVEHKIHGVDFVAINCDSQDLHHAKANKKIHIGKNLTRGLGAGMNPMLGRQAAEENRDEIHEALKGADMGFDMCDEVLRQAVQGISDLIMLPGIINVDFADIRAILQDAGSALMGVGVATGEDRAVEAAKAAVNSPLIDIAIDGARGVLFNISGGADLTMWEINEAAKVITENVDKEAKIIF